MKAIRFLLLCTVLTLICSGCGLFKAAWFGNTSVNEQDYRQYLSDWVEVDVTGAEQVYFYDDHGGFLGDGMTFAVIQFSDASVIPVLEANFGWREFPLSKNLSAALYGSAENGGPLITDDQGNPCFPPVENGYWYFFDRQNDNLAPGGHYDDAFLFDRYSYNFYAALYDTDTNTMYITAFDT